MCLLQLSELTFGRLLAPDDPALVVGEELALGLGQAEGAEGEQHEDLHGGERESGERGGGCLSVIFPCYLHG